MNKNYYDDELTLYPTKAWALLSNAKFIFELIDSVYYTPKDLLSARQIHVFCNDYNDYNEYSIVLALQSRPNIAKSSFSVLILGKVSRL